MYALTRMEKLKQLSLNLRNYNKNLYNTQDDHSKLRMSSLNFIVKYFIIPHLSGFKKQLK